MKDEETGVKKGAVSPLQQLTRMPYLAILVVAIVAVIAAVYVLTLPAPVTAPTPAAFKVTVLSGGQPVEGALVEAYDGATFLAKALTSANGIATFKTALPSKTLTFKVSKQGMKPTQVNANLSIENKTTANLETVSVPGITVTPSPSPVAYNPSKSILGNNSDLGKRINKLYLANSLSSVKLNVYVREVANATPVQNALIRVYDADSDAGPLKEGLAGDGSTFFEGFEENTNVHVSAEADGYWPSSVDATLTPPSKTVVVRLVKKTANNTAVAKIVVQDDSNKTVKDANVWLVQNPGEENTVTGPKKTNAAGMYPEDVNPDYTYYAVVQKDGFLLAKSAEFLGSDDVKITTKKSTANNTASVRVSVVNEDGEPVSGADVALLSRDGRVLPFYPAKKTVAGVASFALLSAGDSFKVTASYNSKIGEGYATLEVGQNNVSISIELKRTLVNLIAVDALTKTAVTNVSFTASYTTPKGQAEISSCDNSTGNSCQSTVRAGITYLFKATATGYFDGSLVAEGAVGEVKEFKAYLIPTSSVQDSLLKLENFVDTLDPGTELAYKAGSVTLRKTHLYKATFKLYVNENNVDRDDHVGLAVRVGTGNEAWIRNIGIPSGVSISAGQGRVSAQQPGSDCKVVAPSDLNNPALKWFDLNFQRGTDTRYCDESSKTCTYEFLVDIAIEPGSSVKSLPIFYRSYVVKGDGSYLRNPFDAELGMNESIAGKKWCGAKSLNATYKAEERDLTCTDYGCIKLTFTQPGATPASGGEGFFAYNDRNLYVDYEVSVGEDTPSGNKLTFTWDYSQFNAVKITLPSLDASGNMVRENTTIAGNPGKVEINVDKATKRTDYLSSRKISGTITLEPPAGAGVEASRATMTAEFKNSFDDGMTHSTYVRLGYSPTAFAVFAYGRQCSSRWGMQANDADAYCNFDCSTCLKLNFTQGTPATKFGAASTKFAAEKSNVDALGLNFFVWDLTPEDTQLEVRLPPQLEKMRAAAFEGGEDIGSFTGNTFKIDVKKDDIDAGESTIFPAKHFVRGVVYAKVKESSEDNVSVALGYKGVSPGYSARLYITQRAIPIVFTAPYPDYYEVRLSPAPYDLKLYQGGGEQSLMQLYVDPLFPADAVYLTVNRSAKPSSPLLLTPPNDGCLSLDKRSEDANFVTYLMKYDASKSTCANYEPNVNSVRDASYSNMFRVSFPAVTEKNFSIDVLAQCGKDLSSDSKGGAHDVSLSNNCTSSFDTSKDFSYYLPLSYEQKWEEEEGNGFMFDNETNRKLFAVVNNRQPVGYASRQVKLLNASGGEFVDRDGVAVYVDDGSTRVFATNKSFGVNATNGFYLSDLTGWNSTLADMVRSAAENTAFRRRTDQDKMFPFSVFNVGGKFQYIPVVKDYNTKSGPDAEMEAKGIVYDTAGKCFRYGTRGIYAFRKEYDNSTGWSSKAKYLVLKDKDILDSGDTCVYQNGQIDLCGAMSFRNGVCLKNCGDGWYYDLKKGESLSLCDEYNAKVKQVVGKTTSEDFGKTMISQALEAYFGCIAASCVASKSAEVTCDGCVKTQLEACSGELSAIAAGCQGCPVAGQICGGEIATAISAIQTQAVPAPSNSKATAGVSTDAGAVAATACANGAQIAADACLVCPGPCGSCTASCEACVLGATDAAAACSGHTAGIALCGTEDIFAQEAAVAASSIVAQSVFSSMGMGNGVSECDYAGAFVWDFLLDSIMRSSGLQSPYGSAQYSAFSMLGGTAKGCTQSFVSCLVGMPANWKNAIAWIVGGSLQEWLPSLQLPERAFLDISQSGDVKSCISWWKNLQTYFIWHDCEGKAMWLAKEEEIGKPVEAGLMSGIGGAATSLITHWLPPTPPGACANDDYLIGKSFWLSLVSDLSGVVIGSIDSGGIKSGYCEGAENVLAHTQDIKDGEKVTFKIKTWG
jgi:hypothetical protein